MADSTKDGFLRGLGVYVGLGVGLLVTGLLLTFVIQSVAADAGIPQTLTDARLLALTYVAVASALSIGAGLWAGVHYGQRNADELGRGVGLALLVTVVGTAVALALGYVGVRLGVDLFAPADSTVSVSITSMVWTMMLIVPAVACGLLSAAFAGTFTATEASATEPAPEPSHEAPPEPTPDQEPEPEPEPEPDPVAGGAESEGAPAGGTEVQLEGGPAAEPVVEPEGGPHGAEPAEPEHKTLECPACEDVFDAKVGPDEPIECPNCGYSASSTA